MKSYRQYYLETRDRRLKYAKEYRELHKQESYAAQKIWRDTHVEHRRKSRRAWYAKNREDQIRKHRVATRKLKAEVLKVYGESCVCCGISFWEVLTVHHVNGGGTKHREEIKGYGTNFYKWLKRNSFPSGFETQCFNCNCSRGLYGYCPHERKSP